MTSYQPGIPTGTVNLDVDYQNIQNNFSALDTIFGIDHVQFSNTTTQKGYHTVAHLVPQGSTPVVVSNIGELFCKTVNDGINTDQTLYFQTGNSRLLQLTRNFVPAAATNGYTFLPGGLIFQWGSISSTGSGNRSGTVTFSSSNIAFPNNCYQVQAQAFYTGTAPNGDATIAIKLNSNTSFAWNLFTSSGAYGGLFWTAIGN